MPGLAALLMEVMKINQVNELFAQAQPKQGPEFVDAILEGCGVDIEFDERELKNIPKEGAFYCYCQSSLWWYRGHGTVKNAMHGKA